MWRVVLDCAALTSALLNPHGSPARLLDFARQGRLRIFATPRMLATVGTILRCAPLKRRHGMSDQGLSGFMADLPVLLCLVQDDNRPRGDRHPGTDLPACATRGRADFLVTSLPLSTTTVPGGTQIATADQLVELIGRSI